MTSRNEARRRSGHAPRRALGAVALALALTGCTDWAGYDLDYILGSTPILSTMRTAVSFEAQEMPLLPAPGAVPRK